MNSTLVRARLDYLASATLAALVLVSSSCTRTHRADTSAAVSEPISEFLTPTNDIELVLTQAAFRGRISSVTVKHSTNLWVSEFGQAPPFPFTLTNYYLLRILKSDGEILTMAGQNARAEITSALAKLRPGETCDFPTALKALEKEPR